MNENIALACIYCSIKQQLFSLKMFLFDNLIDPLSD